MLWLGLNSLSGEVSAEMKELMKEMPNFYNIRGDWRQWGESPKEDSES